MLHKSLSECAIRVEDIHEAKTHAVQFVFARGILFGVGDVQLVTDGHDVEWRIPSRQVWVRKIAR